jgi:hypothetical protein
MSSTVFDCYFGISCSNKDCCGSHPDGWNWMINLDCPNRGNCESWSCQHRHLDGRALKKHTECVYGIYCETKDCKWNHPEGWDWKLNDPYYYCPENHDPNTCIYQHYPDYSDVKCIRCGAPVEGSDYESYSICSRYCLTYDDRREYRRHKGRRRKSYI